MRVLILLVALVTAVVFPRLAMALDMGGGIRVEDGLLSGSAQVDAFNYSGSASTYTSTWTKPSWATVVYMWCVGGGAGGPGGNKVSSSPVSPSGGASAAPADGWFRASELPATLTVSVGKGATGGSGATTNGGTGGASGSRNDSTIGVSGCVMSPQLPFQTACYVFSYGSNAASTYWTGNAGGTPTVSQSCTGLSSYAPGGGGGGGGILLGVAADGSDGADGCQSPGSKGAKGTAAGTRNGSAGSSYTSGRRVGGGGGGGAASITAGVNGGNGGNGGSPGGGGGGGGNGLNDTNNGGRGGDGGNGACVIVTF